jgi:hypothetical protein
LREDYEVVPQKPPGQLVGNSLIFYWARLRSGRVPQGYNHKKGIVYSLNYLSFTTSSRLRISEYHCHDSVCDFAPVLTIDLPLAY